MSLEYRIVKTRRSYGGKKLPSHEFALQVESYIAQLGRGKHLNLHGDVFLDGLQWRTKCGCKAKLHRSELRPCLTLGGDDFLEWTDYLDIVPCQKHEEQIKNFANYNYK